SDDPDNPQWMPGFHQTVTCTFGGHSLAIQHAGLPNSEIADIDHFLNFTFRLGGDFPDFGCNESSEICFVLGQEFGPAFYNLSTDWCRCLTPSFESIFSFINCLNH